MSEDTDIPIDEQPGIVGYIYDDDLSVFDEILKPCMIDWTEYGELIEMTQQPRTLVLPTGSLIIAPYMDKHQFCPPFLAWKF